MMLRLTIFIDRWLSNNLARVVDKLLAKLFRQLVSLALRCIALVDIVLHICKQVRISTVEQSDAARGNFTINSSKATEDNVTKHDERISANALPEASSINFAPYIRPPKLLLNGRDDEEDPWLTRGLPLWNLLREPKQLVLVPGAGHMVPLEARVAAINKFLDQTLGPVRR